MAKKAHNTLTVPVEPRSHHRQIVRAQHTAAQQKCDKLLPREEQPTDAQHNRGKTDTSTQDGHKTDTSTQDGHVKTQHTSCHPLLNIREASRCTTQKGQAAEQQQSDNPMHNTRAASRYPTHTTQSAAHKSKTLLHNTRAASRCTTQ
jgi:hypothetical protein